MITLKLKNIQNIHFEYNSTFDYGNLDTNSLQVSFNNHTVFNGTEAEYELEVQYLYNKKTVLLNQKIKIAFTGDFTQYPNKCKQNELKNIILQFQNIGIGVIRGIIAINTQDTELAKYPLPLIDKTALEQNITKALRDSSL